MRATSAPTSQIAAEIPWALPPTERLEDIDALSLSVHELLEYATDLQSEARQLRLLVHEAIAMIARQRDKLARATRVIDSLRAEIRALRQDAS